MGRMPVPQWRNSFGQAERLELPLVRWLAERHIRQRGETAAGTLQRRDLHTALRNPRTDAALLLVIQIGMGGQSGPRIDFGQIVQAGVVVVPVAFDVRSPSVAARARSAWSGTTPRQFRSSPVMR